jgi:glycosyltransferase involved in cell wall biosynthesis
MKHENIPLLSICMITYNHEQYIAQAIESVLMQKTGFDLELVIGEDCSTDNTGLICREYTKRHPQIKLLSRERNFGMINNFIDTYKNCKGKYIAILEGDDYWTDTAKLQKQVDFLEKNPNFNITFHEVSCFIQERNVTEKNYFVPPAAITSILELSEYNYITNLSVVYRNNNNILPDYFKSLPLYDYPLHLWICENKKIKYFPEVMGVHRRYATSEFHSKGFEFRYLTLLKTIDILINNYNDTVKRILINSYRTQNRHFISELFRNTTYFKEESNIEITEYIFKYAGLDIFCEVYNKEYRKKADFINFADDPQWLAKFISVKSLIKAILVKAKFSKKDN